MSTGNTYKVQKNESAPVFKPKGKLGRIKVRIIDSILNLLDGTILEKQKTIKQLPFALYLTFLALLYIANIYQAEMKIRKIQKCKRELKELRYEYITIKADLMHKSKQTEIAKQLRERGMKIKESKIPPSVIEYSADSINEVNDRVNNKKRF